MADLEDVGQASFFVFQNMWARQYSSKFNADNISDCQKGIGKKMTDCTIPLQTLFHETSLRPRNQEDLNPKEKKALCVHRNETMLDWTANGQSTNKAEIQNSRSQCSIAESLTHSNGRYPRAASLLELLPPGKLRTNRGTRGTAVPRGAPLGGSQQPCSMARRL